MQTLMEVNKMRIPLPVLITKEEIKGKEIFVAECPLVDIASQGKTEEEAKQNLKEALLLYWEEPESKKIQAYVEFSITNINLDVPQDVSKCQNFQ